MLGVSLLVFILVFQRDWLLVPAWSFSFGGEKQRGQETQAIVHDGVIYITASYSRMFAIDAKTGKHRA